ncbi:MAG: hypothetical protein L6437_06430, partial [Kiritimatiellae bacterium]|nr:hypothetical protein [Kiritimatiellia bacterium]
ALTLLKKSQMHNVGLIWRSKMRKLFLDNRNIWKMSNLKRVMNQPVKYSGNPVLEPRNIWEKGGLMINGSPLYIPEEKKFKLWYAATEADAFVTEVISMCYATSDDGINFERPNLSIVNYKGILENNILPFGIIAGQKNQGELTVIYEPNDPNPARRYKAIFFEFSGKSAIFGKETQWFWPQKGDGMSVAFSPDGIRWKRYEKNPVLPTLSDTCHSVVYDLHCKRYMAYGRFRKFGSNGEWLGNRTEDWGRAVAYTTSKDFTNWSEPELVLEPDVEDGSMINFYGMSVLHYEGYFIGLLQIYHLMEWLKPEDKNITLTGNVDLQMVVSTNGIAWQRLGNRATFLPNGYDEDWDAGTLYPGSNPVVLDDKIMIYYCASARLHEGETTINKQRQFSIGLATLRRDGFVSLDSGWEEGMLMTRYGAFSGGDLYVNTDATGGVIQITICGSDANPIPGFERSDPITGDQLKSKVIWQGKRLADANYKAGFLRFIMRRAKLYSFWFETGTSDQSSSRV